MGNINVTYLYIAAGLVIAAAIIIAIIVRNTKKENLKKEIDSLNVRFNAVKTVPLAFKLSKAQAMAKRNDSTADSVKTYYEKYELAQQHIDELSTLFENVDDKIASKDIKGAKETIETIKYSLDESEKEVADIDKFLEQFSEEESTQRDNSAKLKEQFREVKLYANKNSNNLSIGYDGISKKIEKIENLFSESEEYMYTNDYVSSEDCLEKIKTSITDIKKSIIALPSLVADTKGVVPTLIDEVNRQYALSRQRGVYTKHLDIDKKLEEIQTQVSDDIKTLSEGEVGEVKNHNEQLKAKLNDMLSSLNKENEAYQNLKSNSDKIADNLTDLKNLYKYVDGAYKKDKDRFGIEDLDSYINDTDQKIKQYQADYIIYNQDIAANEKPATELVKEADALLDNTNKDKESLAKYKAIFDKNTNEETRAKTQVMKLQVVLNEVEVKVQEYHLPTIAASYNDDLIKSREKIAHIKSLLKEIPINMEELSTTVDDAIDFIYKFYNNVNNIVGMAIMVENAIVFGNKYRSTYPDVERDLSKAEFSYLNGEYTKALTMAISCMEKLFPNKKKDDFLENA